MTTHADDHALARTLARTLDAEVCSRACDARDGRFDGLFVVAITTTRIYCRPVCPARVSHRDRRRFYGSPAEAERAGYRPCLRCRPELAPGCGEMEVVSQLAAAAVRRIAAGALNGRSVAALAGEFGVSERHLRRALEREVGVSPVQLALTHRLLFAKRLLADTALSVTHIAYASGFQSLRRFNAVCQQHYRLPPSALRRSSHGETGGAAASRSDVLRLTLSYRPPLAWDALLGCLARDAIPGIDVVRGRRYARTVRIDGRIGAVVVEDSVIRTTRRTRLTSSTCSVPSDEQRAPGSAHLTVDVSPSLVPVLMPLLARLRHLFDLDAEPSVVDRHLERRGLGALVRQRPGIRIPGAFSGFEVAARVLLGGWPHGTRARTEVTARLVATLGESIETGIPGLDRLFPSARRVTEAGASTLRALGVPRPRADAIVAVAHAVVDGALHLTPGQDPVATRRALLSIPGVGDRGATMILMRALSWPDAFPIADGVRRHARGTSTPASERTLAEDWRPWRSYAALHLWLEELEETGEREEIDEGETRTTRTIVARHPAA